MYALRVRGSALPLLLSCSLLFALGCGDDDRPPEDGGLPDGFVPDGEIPDGFVPCAHLYPAHPLKDTQGRAIAFSPERHRAFQQVLRRFGDPRYLALKQRVLHAVAAGEDPSSISLTPGRFARTNVRVALRQIEAAEQPPPPATPPTPPAG